MFKNLTNVKYKRTAKEALGFYLAYFFLALLIGGLAGALVGGLANQRSVFDMSLRVGNVVAIIFSAGISYYILKAKKLTNRYGFLVLAILAGILAGFGGALLGLIPAAYLTTKK